MYIISNIKNLFIFTGLLLCLTVCDISAVHANDDLSSISNETSVTTTLSISTPTPKLLSGKTPTLRTAATSHSAVVVLGLSEGATVIAAKNNSKVLNIALKGGNKNLIIPNGIWYTGKTIIVQKNTTLTFNGKLHQLEAASEQEDYFLLRISGRNVTLNNPWLSQKGRVYPHGTHACLAIYGAYNIGNIKINGGILEWGASNNFQGGRNNTVFNGTIFRDSVEHLVYANGISGNGSKSARSNGLVFNNCVFERPGNGLYKELEANHIQIRNYKNVEFNNCIVKGKKKTSPNQYGILVTNIKGMTINDTIFSDYTAGLLYTGKGTKEVVFNRVTAAGNGNKHIRRSHESGDVLFINCIFDNPYGIAGDTKFNNCIFKPTKYYMKSIKGAKIIFESCTWDYSKSTYSKAFVKEEGSTVIFSGTQTKIAPTDGHILNWGLLELVN